MKKNSSPQRPQEQKSRLDGRILARVHAHESLAAVLGGGIKNLTYKGDVSDIDDPEPP